MGLFRGDHETIACAVKACVVPLALLALLALQNGIFYPSMILFSMLLHESGHLFAARCFGISLKPRAQACPGFCLVYDCESTAYLPEIAICAAGAAVSAGTAVLARFCGLADVKGGLFFIIVNLCFAAFNLLPCRYLDGGGILRATLHLILPCYTADKLADIISDITLAIILIVIAVSFVFVKENFSLAVIAVYLTVCAARDAIARIKACGKSNLQKNI